MPSLTRIPTRRRNSLPFAQLWRRLALQRPPLAGRRLLRKRLSKAIAEYDSYATCSGRTTRSGGSTSFCSLSCGRRLLRHAPERHDPDAAKRPRKGRTHDRNKRQYHARTEWSLPRPAREAFLWHPRRQVRPFLLLHSDESQAELTRVCTRYRALPTPLIRPLRHLSPDLETYLLTFLGTFPSILIACAISYGLSGITSSAFTLTPLTVGSFGATAVLLYATPEAPLSQPRNVIGGQTLSAIVGAVISQLFALNDKFTNSLASGQDNTIATADSWPSLVPLSGTFAVGVATLVMQLTGTVHPPGASSGSRFLLTPLPSLQSSFR